MFKRSLSVAMALMFIVALVPLQGLAFAADGDVTLSSLMQDNQEPVTLYLRDWNNLSTLDPQVATDSVSIDYTEGLFLGLTDYHPETAEIRPELATEWSYDADTLTWTFTIRDDVPWVRWDPMTQEATVLRNVVAGDFVTGIRRACDPNVADFYGDVVGANIAGCADVRNTAPEDVTADMLEAVSVAAPDDTTLEITLAGPRGYFFSMVGMWVLRAVPGEVIEEFGDEWTEPGNLVSNGPFFMDEWVRGVRRVMVRNPNVPTDMAGPGNVERVVTTRIDDGGTGYALYQDDQLDLHEGIPTAELQNVLADETLSTEVRQSLDLVVYYLAFSFDKPPFDDVHARRAFAAATNREQFVSEVRQNQGIPMMHFTPPGMFGAVPVNEVGIDGAGVGYDPEFALAEIEEAGYPNCEGFPDIDIITYASAESWAVFLQAEVERNLGCDPGIFTVEALEFSVLLSVIDRDTPVEERPNMWSLGWGPDYADAHNWVHDVLHCEVGAVPSMRACGEVDELIIQAAEETDPDRRAELYREIEEMFFGYDGVMPLIPLYMRAGYDQLKPWVDWAWTTDALFGGHHWDWVTIDQEAQLAARG